MLPSAICFTTFIHCTASTFTTSQREMHLASMSSLLVSADDQLGSAASTILKICGFAETQHVQASWSSVFPTIIQCCFDMWFLVVVITVTLICKYQLHALYHRCLFLLQTMLMLLVHARVTLAGGFCCRSAAALGTTAGFPNESIPPSSAICVASINNSLQGHGYCSGVRWCGVLHLLA